MPDDESDRGGNNQNDEVPIADGIAIAVFDSDKISKHKNDYWHGSCTQNFYRIALPIQPSLPFTDCFRDFLPDITFRHFFVPFIEFQAVSRSAAARIL